MINLKINIIFFQKKHTLLLIFNKSMILIYKLRINIKEVNRENYWVINNLLD